MFTEAMSWRRVFISLHSSHHSLFITKAFVFRHFLLQETYFPYLSLFTPLEICSRNVNRWEWSTVGVVPLWSIKPLWLIKDTLCLTIARTSAPRVASQGRTSQELLEGACAGVHKRISSNSPSPSTVSFAVGVLGGVEMIIYPLSPLLNVLTAGIP